MTPDYPNDWTASKKRKADVLIYVIGMMEDLKGEGIVSGGYEMSEEGYEQYRRLRDSGFEPTEEELKSTMAFVYQSAGTEMASKALNGELPQ